MPDVDEVKRGIDVASGFIAYRMRSEYEVRRRLKRAQITDEASVEAIERLKEMGLVNDRAFAAAYARDQISRLKRGPLRVANGLRTLGVSKEFTQAAVAETVAQNDPFEIAFSAAQRRWAQLSRIDDVRKRKKRVYEFLVRRGFEYGDARKITDTLEREDSD